MSNKDNMDVQENYQIITRSKIKNNISMNIDGYNSESDPDYSPTTTDTNSDDEFSFSESEDDDISETKIIDLTKSRKNNEKLIDIREMEDVDKMIIGKIFSKYIPEDMEEDNTDLMLPTNPDIVYKSNDASYFKSLNSEKKIQIISLEKEISNINNSVIPLRFNILESNLDINNKATAIRKLEAFSKMDHNSGEYHKIKHWIDGILKIPFGNYVDLPINFNNSSEEINSYLLETQKILNKNIYGHHNAKNHIIQLISQWIVNPSSIGSVLAIQGSMGIGKTTLVKEGISKCLNRPYFFISLGGATDSSYLDGHSYTYEGSQPGKIVDIIKEAQCMNPVIYFDELDKISNTSKGEEITNLLIHLTDHSQNSHFQDKYYSGINLDLSRCLFIFSYNNIENVNPILLDRMYNIKLDDFNIKDKIQISFNYLLPTIYKTYNINKNDIIFNENNIEYLVNNYCKEDGVRNMKRCLETIISKINVLKLCNNLDLEYNIKNFKFPLTVSNEIIDNLLIKNKSHDPPFQMYT